MQRRKYAIVACEHVSRTVKANGEPLTGQHRKVLNPATTSHALNSATMPPLHLPQVWMSAKKGHHLSSKRKCVPNIDHPNDGAGAMDQSNFPLSAQGDLHAELLVPNLYADLLVPDWSRGRAAKWGHPNMMICARLQQEIETEFVSARRSHLNVDPTLTWSGCPPPFAPHHQASLALP